MAFFIAAGTISNDIVRKETRNGVLATFRLETGAPRGGRLWIDIECWGHLAGTIAHHALKGRGVTVSGRLTQKTWRDQTTGESRHRYVVTANEIDLHKSSEQDSPPAATPSAVLARGVIDALHPSRLVKNGTVSSFRLTTGRANSKTGRLWIDVEHWQPMDGPDLDIRRRAVVAVIGSLAWQSTTNDRQRSRFFLDAQRLTTTETREVSTI